MILLGTLLLNDQKSFLCFEHTGFSSHAMSLHEFVIRRKLNESAPQAPKKRYLRYVVRAGGRGPGDPPGSRVGLGKRGNSQELHVFAGTVPLCVRGASMILRILKSKHPRVLGEVGGRGGSL